jgi:EF hand
MSAIVNGRSLLAFGIGIVMVGLAACGQTRQAPIETPPRFQEGILVPGDAAEEVEALTARRDRYDEDGDGFVSPAEAEGYWRRYFAQLDDNNDGRLSRAELDPEAPGTPDLELANEELVGWAEQEYVDDGLREYNLRADRTIGMMSTSDFDEMVGAADAAISDPRPGLLP